MCIQYIMVVNRISKHNVLYRTPIREHGLSTLLAGNKNFQLYAIFAVAQKLHTF
jgi:hypothetical protein